MPRECERIWTYLRIFLRPTIARPAIPEPISRSVPGSGTKVRSWKPKDGRVPAALVITRNGGISRSVPP